MIVADNKRIAKNTVFLYFRMLLIMGVTLYTSRVVLGILGAEDFGLYNVVGGIVVMFSFLNGALSAATSRFITVELGRNDYGQLKKVFNVALFAHIVIALIVVVLAETVGLWFFYNKMTIPDSRMDAAFAVYQISILTSFFTLTQVPYNAAIVAHEDMGIYAYVGFVDAIARLLIVFALSLSPIDKLTFYAVLLCLLSVAILCYYRFYCSRKYAECKLKFYKDFALCKKMIFFASSDLIGNASVLAQGQGLNLLLNVFFGPTVNAARAIAYQVQGAASQFSGNFMTAVRPQIIKLYASGSVKEMMNLVERSSCFAFYLMWIICLPLILERNYILTFWLGSFPDHTKNFVILVLFICMLNTLKFPRTAVFHATGHILRTNICVGLVLCSVFPISYVLLKLGNVPESVFYAANVTVFSSEFVSVKILKRYIDYSAIKYLLNVHLRCFVVMVLSSILPYYVYDSYMGESFARLVLTCLICFISICIVSCTIGMNKEMRNKMLNIIRSRLKRV
ncbi:MAG: hypothetical protein J5534_04660 [Fibrobacter sp.]|nr:hypothetical protein [Fibrobacter sp.]